MAKKLLFALSLFLLAAGVYGQVGIGTLNPDSSSELDITAIDKGVLLPRVALTDINDSNTIANPAISLLVYNTTDTGGDLMPGFYYWDGSKWNRLNTNNDSPDLLPPTSNDLELDRATKLLTSTVNGISASVNLEEAVKEVTTNELTLVGNNLTSVVNGVTGSVDLEEAVKEVTTNELTLVGTNLTSVVNGVTGSVDLEEAVKEVTTNELTLVGTNLTSVVNGVTGSVDLEEAVKEVTTNELTLVGNNLTSVVNGVTGSVNLEEAVKEVTTNELTLVGNNLTSVVNGVTGSVNLEEAVKEVTTNELTLVGNNLTSVVNGVTGSVDLEEAVKEVTTNELTLVGTNLTSVVNGVTGSVNLEEAVKEVTTNELTLVGNNLTSVVNGVTGSVDLEEAVKEVTTNELTLVGNNLTSVVNGVTGSVDLEEAVKEVTTNELTLVGNNLTSVVNGVTGSVDLEEAVKEVTTNELTLVGTNLTSVVNGVTGSVDLEEAVKEVTTNELTLVGTNLTSVVNGVTGSVDLEEAVKEVTTNELTLVGTNLTSVVNGVTGSVDLEEAVKEVTTNELTLVGNNLTSVVNGVTGSVDLEEAVKEVTTNELTLVGTNLTSVVNGVTGSVNLEEAVKEVTTNELTLVGTNLTSVVNGVTGSVDLEEAVKEVTTNELTLVGNNLTSVVNGVTGSVNLEEAVKEVTTNELILVGTNLTSVVNGVTGSVDLEEAVKEVTTNVLTLEGTNLTSVVNGVSDSVNLERALTEITTVSNTLEGSHLSTTVNGVTGNVVDLGEVIEEVIGEVTTNDLDLDRDTKVLTSTVNGISSFVDLGEVIEEVIGEVTTNELALEGTNLTSVVNGVTDSVDLSAIVSASGWSLSGNEAVTDDHFLGSINNVGLKFRTNNIERMRITSAGHIGIGTATPAFPLHISSSTIGAVIERFSTAGLPYAPGIRFRRNRSATADVNGAVRSGDALGMLFFEGNNGSGYNGASSLTVKAAEDFTPATQGTSMEFLTVPNGGTAGIARMTISENGNIGIGTAAPNAPLQFANTMVDRKIVLFERVNTNNDNEFYGFGVKTGGVLSSQIVGSGNSFGWYTGTSATASAELMRLTGQGRLGINTDPGTIANASFALDVLNPSSSTDGLLLARFQQANKDHGVAIGSTGIRMIGSVANGDFRISPKGTGRVYLDGPAQIRILDTGAADTHVVTTGATDNILRKRPISDLIPATAWGLSGNAATAAQFLGTTNAQPLIIKTGTGNNTERMRISASGKVGIGEYSADNEVAMLNVRNRETGGTPIARFMATGLNQGVAIYHNELRRTGIEENQLFIISSAGTGDIDLKGGNNILLKTRTGTTETERMRITSAGHVGIGTTTPNAPLQFAKAEADRKIVLYEEANNNNQFFGFGVKTGMLSSQIVNSTNSFGWYRGSSASASAELMRLTGQGRLGINTDPGTIANASFALDVLNPSSSTDGLLLARFQQANKDHGVAIGSTGIRMIGSVANGDFRISPKGTGRVYLDGPAQIRILDTGAADTHVVTTGATDNILRKRPIADLIPATGWGLSGNAATAAQFLGTTNPQPLVIRANNTERMRISAAGYVGIGVNDPDADNVMLSVRNNRTGISYARFMATAGNVGIEIAPEGLKKIGSSLNQDFSISSAGTGAVFLNGGNNVILRTRTGTTETERMRITSAGNVGIGNTAPNAPLQFAKAEADRKIVLYEEANNNNQFLVLELKRVC